MQHILLIFFFLSSFIFILCFSLVVFHLNWFACFLARYVHVCENVCTTIRLHSVAFRFQLHGPYALLHFFSIIMITRAIVIIPIPPHTKKRPEERFNWKRKCKMQMATDKIMCILREMNITNCTYLF